MLGAIIGDIVGSRFEFNNHKSKDFDLFAKGCFATDDSVMTLAVAKAVMDTRKLYPNTEGEPAFFDTLRSLTVTYMQQIGRRYPNCGFGGMFYRWVFSDAPKPYQSFGNGAAMRVSPAGFAARSIENALELAKAVTEVTHDHAEGIKGAQAVAAAIYMARCGALKEEIREHIETSYYPLNFTIDRIRDSYRFNETCQETVPQAIECFLEAASFEDAIRSAISLGGDSDTIAAITGAIAEAYYGVPDWIKNKALSYLDADLRGIYDEWAALYAENRSQFRVLTKYVAKLKEPDSFGKRIFDRSNDGSTERPIRWPYVEYDRLVCAFTEDFYQFFETHPEYSLDRYSEILEKNGLKWGAQEMRSADTASLNEQCILALIMGAIRADRFCDGALLGFFEDGSILKWLKRLESMD